jgi:hypothetical protein
VNIYQNIRITTRSSWEYFVRTLKYSAAGGILFAEGGIFASFLTSDSIPEYLADGAIGILGGIIAGVANGATTVADLHILPNIKLKVITIDGGIVGTFMLNRIVDSLAVVVDAVTGTE